MDALLLFEKTQIKNVNNKENIILSFLNKNNVSDRDKFLKIVHDKLKEL